ncbi:MAG: [FeFe] hydrogenase H-cluster maturation GTPase HydF [Christensenella sp.]|uniref:[FeFe] hydrogenase H-cluster maturation GTPase HydF n=1 Tax=Christensenella sp. TaxID=1935934 RepID=UPI002B20870E|nr:[FeFe] hydrogenase H-cluster maturation GTPase HydF [Christensenella sp.]MEA5002248.1 [FeFe] hydrogenase H-cluster maturation GTPase HydF [Christensenella sp.]
MSGLNETPRANRVHIAFFGKTNAGKSSAINAITGQDIALVSDVAGTTTDPVYKAMELLPIGPVVFIDTAGLDDTTKLGEARIKKTDEVVDKADIAVFVIRCGDTDLSVERGYMRRLKEKNTPVLVAYNIFEGKKACAAAPIGEKSVVINAKTGAGTQKLKQLIIDNAAQGEERSITGDMVSVGDVVMLVMPQDIQAPKGRLILPQVQVTRDLLDNGCRVVSVKTEDLTPMLGELKHPPKLVITDSQVFKYVNEHLSRDIPLTSFSMLMAKYKGDIEAFVKGARSIADLKSGDHVLIAESCTHHAQKGDIAREKLPNWLNQYAGGELVFENTSGHGFPDDIEKYKVIVHCGGCMINRKNMLSKIDEAKNAGVPITNFGVAIAFLNSMLDRVIW